MNTGYYNPGYRALHNYRYENKIANAFNENAIQ